MLIFVFQNTITVGILYFWAWSSFWN